MELAVSLPPSTLTLTSAACASARVLKFCQGDFDRLELKTDSEACPPEGLELRASVSVRLILDT